MNISLKSFIPNVHYKSTLVQILANIWTGNSLWLSRSNLEQVNVTSGMSWKNFSNYRPCSQKPIRSRKTIFGLSVTVQIFCITQVGVGNMTIYRVVWTRRTTLLCEQRYSTNTITDNAWHVCTFEVALHLQLVTMQLHIDAPFFHLNLVSRNTPRNFVELTSVIILHVTNV